MLVNIDYNGQGNLSGNLQKLLVLKCCFSFAVFTFKIKMFMVLKFKQQKYQETKENGLLFELKPVLIFLRFRA